MDILLEFLSRKIGSNKLINNYKLVNKKESRTLSD